LPAPDRRKEWRTSAAAPCTLEIERFLFLGRVLGVVYAETAGACWLTASKQQFRGHRRPIGTDRAGHRRRSRPSLGDNAVFTRAEKGVECRGRTVDCHTGRPASTNRSP